MIALLNGQIAYKSLDHVILDVGGVGYRLLVPLSTYYSLPDNGQTQLHVHTHVREDAIQLFGFGSSEEKEIFSILISVSGVGPKLAINILSHIPTAELATALTNSDIARLSSLPGIGKKSAERLAYHVLRVSRPEAESLADAIRNGTEMAKREMPPVTLREKTIPHEVIGVFTGARVLLKPASPGTGVIAGGAVRAVLELAGVRDVLAKSLGSNNHINVTKATMAALKSLRSKEEIMAIRHSAA